MDKSKLQKAIKLVRENSNKRNFKQSIDLIINLKSIDLKKQDNRVDTYAQLHFEHGKKAKICGLVGPELLESAKSNFDTVISVADFSKHTDKKALKKLAKEHDFFVAQANVMPQVATSFGRSLGPRGKMPNPKAGCVVPPNANLQPLVEKLNKTIRIKIETNPIFQTGVGSEDMEDSHIIDNIMTIHTALAHALPSDVHNIRNVFIKLTMGKAIKVGEDAKEEAPVEEKKEAVKEEKPAEEAPKELPKEGLENSESSQKEPKAEEKKEEAPVEQPKEEPKEEKTE